MPIPHVSGADRQQIDPVLFGNHQNDQNANLNLIKTESQWCKLKDGETIPTVENIDNEEDETVGCFNEEVEKYFSTTNHSNGPNISGHSNRLVN